MNLLTICKCVSHSLIETTAAGDEAVLTEMLKNLRLPVSAPEQGQLNYSLLMAVTAGSLKMTESLLNAGVKPGVFDR